MKRKLLVLTAASLAFAPAANYAFAAISKAAAAPLAPAKVTFDENGVAHVPPFDLPPSVLSSPEAQGLLKKRAGMPGMDSMPPMNVDIKLVRDAVTKSRLSQVEEMKKAYPVDVADSMIGGVPVRTFTAKGKKPDPERVLINLHGGAFSICWETCSALESIPIAALSGYKVISINYRMAPEAKHPAAIEDIEKVYRELLKSYLPKHIGIYGCSAGGALTAQAASWLPAHGLPQVAAVGIFGAGGVRFMAGDSAYIAGYVDGSFAPPAKAGTTNDYSRGYFTAADTMDATISPALHPDVIKTFPPALIITGTRAMDMSPAIVTNSALIKAGVKSTLIVGEAMGHCYIYHFELPEARDGYEAIVAFFHENLN